MDQQDPWSSAAEPEGWVEPEEARLRPAKDSVVGLAWDICVKNFATVGDALAFLTRDLVWTNWDDEADSSVSHWWGRKGFATWWGPPIGENSEAGPLRVDLDINAGRARVMWVPTGEVGSEDGVPAFHRALRILETTDASEGREGEMTFVTVPAEEARVTPAWAFRAIYEYASTMGKPTCVSWGR